MIRRFPTARGFLLRTRPKNCCAYRGLEKRRSASSTGGRPSFRTYRGLFITRERIASPTRNAVALDSRLSVVNQVTRCTSPSIRASLAVSGRPRSIDRRRTVSSRASTAFQRRSCRFPLLSFFFLPPHVNPRDEEGHGEAIEVADGSSRDTVPVAPRPTLR